MGERIRLYEWDKHPLGNPIHWPLSLKTGIRIMLHSKHPIFIWWTQQMYMFHNDAYVPLMGKKHPEGLGAKGYQVWAETWPQLGAVLEGILAGDEAFYGQELEVLMNRKGHIDETYWTFSYSAMPDDEGKVNGIFCACTEVTESVLAKRRLQTLKDLSEAMAGQATLPGVCEQAGKVLEENTSDISFSLLYLVNASSGEATLTAQSGKGFHLTIPENISLSQTHEQNLWPLEKVFKERQPVLVNLPIEEPLGDLRPPRAVVLPLTKSGQQTLIGFLIVGLNQRLEYNEAYQNFLCMLVGQIEMTLSSLQARQQAELERKQLEALFMEAPAPICILDGENLVYELVNPSYQQLFPGRELLGKPIVKVLPEIEQNKVWQTFQQVFQTGQTHEETHMLIPIINPDTGASEDRYFRYVQQARYTVEGKIDGVVVYAFEVTEQIQSRHKVEESEKQLRMITDALPVLIGYQDRQQTYRFANRAYQDWFGYSPEKLIGRPSREVVGEEAYQQVKGYIERALAGEQLSFEARMPYRENFIKYTQMNFVPDFKEGEVVGFYTLVSDITELKQGQEALRQSEERLQKALSIQTVGVIFFDLEGVIHEANEAFQQMSGYFQEDFRNGGVRWDQLTPSEFMEVTFQSREELFSKGQNTPYEKQYICPDGSRWWGLFSGKRLSENECVEFVLDITESKRAEEALQESEQWFRTMAEAAGILIAQTDTAGNAIYFNQEWVKLTGRTMEELLLYGWVDYFHPEDAQGFVEAYQQAFERRQVLKREFRLRIQQGEYRWQLAVVSPRFGPDGTFAGYVSSCIDITSQKQAEQKLQGLMEKLATANEELRAANEEIIANSEAVTRTNEELARANQQLRYVNTDLDNFIYAASHDLKAPINNIEGLLKLLLNSLSEESSRKERVYKTSLLMQESIERFKQTIADLSEVTKIRKENQEPLVEVDLEEMLKQVQLDLKDQIQEADAQLMLDTAACRSIRLSKKNLRSIVYNLLSNAIKYRSAERRLQVNIHCEQSEEYTILSVADNGLGMEISKDLFSMFKRFHTHVEGLGIGLYMVKNIVENAGGKIEVES